jgi:hypothetical protein
MSPYANIAHASLKLSYDKELFVREYDEHIFPASKPFIPITDQWYNMQRLNPLWHVLPADRFRYYDDLITTGATEVNGVTHQWDMVNLMQAQGDSPNGGGAYWRHRNLDNPKTIKPQFKDLQIVRWIQDTLPAEAITGIHCVSIEPSGFATIHRDGYWAGSGPNPAKRNGYYNQGYVVVNINVSNGGVPLLWCMDHEQETPRAADSDCYLVSDYFLHAVPLTTTRRRQIRVSMIPTDDLRKLIDESTAVIIPDGYKFTF